jgi:hypothetical protein
MNYAFVPWLLLLLPLTACERLDRRAAHASIEVSPGEVRVQLRATPLAGERLLVRTTRVENGRATLIVEEALAATEGAAAHEMVLREVAPGVWRAEDALGEQWLSGVAFVRAVAAAAGEARVEFAPTPGGASRTHEIRWRAEVWSAAEVRAAFGEKIGEGRARRWVR